LCLYKWQNFNEFTKFLKNDSIRVYLTCPKTHQIQSGLSYIFAKYLEYIICFSRPSVVSSTISSVANFPQSSNLIQRDIGKVISLEIIRLMNWQGKDLDQLFLDPSHVYHYQPQLFDKKRKSGQSKHILVIGPKSLVADNLNSRFRNFN
jgi:hypothetical protein